MRDYKILRKVLEKKEKNVVEYEYDACREERIKGKEPAGLRRYWKGMRMNMKKWMVYLSVGMLALGMTACGNKGNGGQSTESKETTQSTEPETETTTEASQPVESESIPTTTPEEMSGWSEEMEGIRQAVVDALGENYWPNSQIQPEVLESIYGITSDMYEDYMGEMPMISVNVDTLLIIRAKDDKVDEVEAALNAYRDRMVEDTMQYPMNLGKIQASKVEKTGNYVCFVQLGADTTEASENGEEAVITHCREQNDLAVEAIEQKVTK